MTYPRVLVMENQAFRRRVLVKMLKRLGVLKILQAFDTEQAMVQMHLAGGVDIVLCDLAVSSIECLHFLKCAGDTKMVEAVILYGDLPSELERALGQMESLSGIELLGILPRSLQLRSLHRYLHSYKERRVNQSSGYVVSQQLPSEEDVRRGLALGEFRAWFQPKFEMQTGISAGAEALVRWEHPARGTLLPKDFLAAVVAYDLIDDMFKQLLEQCLSLLGILRRKGFNLELALNLHASQLIGNHLTDHIQASLQRHAMPGSTLLFEVSENGLLNLTQSKQESLVRLRLLGCGLSVDDFGVGLSSLKLLCQLPFNQIKLDGQFVQNLLEPRNRAVVASTVAIARSLKMSLVIEGVSSMDIRDALLEMGCAIGQGYYLGMPMTGHGMLKWLGSVDSGLKQNKS